MPEGEQAGASTAEAGANQQVGWRADDEWMDEYRAADSRGMRDLNASSTRPGMAPEEEALIQVFPLVMLMLLLGFACRAGHGCLRSLLKRTKVLLVSAIC